MSPATPHVWAKYPNPVLRMCQFPSDGRYTATSAFPSPSKSPTTGLSPATPNPTGENVPFESRVYQVPVEGRNIARSAFPSPSWSAGTGTSPTVPHVYSANDCVAELKMYHVLLD